MPPRIPNPVRLAEDGIVEKRCGKCTLWKPLTSVYWRFRPDRQVWESPCSDCHRAYMKEYVAAHPVPYEKARQYAYKSRYGITIEEYQDLLEAQNGGCAVCGKPPSGRNEKLSVDHDHETGQVRGLLCYKHNTAAGLLDDDPELAAQLYLYLKGELKWH